MYAIRELFFSCLVILWMNWILSEVPPWCCAESFTNKSVSYRVNTGEHCRNSIWNREKTPIKDEHGNVNKNIVLDYGSNWILLTGNFSGISFKCMEPDTKVNTLQCTDPCNSGKVNRLKEGGGGDRGEGGHGTDGTGGDFTTAIIGVIAVIIIIIFIIIIIMWKLGFCSKHTANRPKANPANGGFRAVPQEDQEESGV
ncbi:hypothetical protein KOW79_000130 [Hemibagrus wyckioides]|uniref:Uncharacterized protein n=1 Tax=Hemibagrus wyckioides TaxID=337641 RepID=A0A9D3SSV3_9TELE|nr:hypothetical protein KOW79_000130 [Hemibagrus wyckioides]